MGDSGRAAARSWAEMAEVLVLNGELDKTISNLESLVSNFEKELAQEEFLKKEDGEFSVSVAEDDLSNLYSTKGLNLAADGFASSPGESIYGNEVVPPVEKLSTVNQFSESRSDASSAKIRDQGDNGESPNLKNEGFSQENGEDDDDWEATADRAPEAFISPLHEPEASKSSHLNESSVVYKRRGRGHFAYKTNGLYSDNPSDEISNSSDDSPEILARDLEQKTSIYGTNHVLVLSGLPLSTKTSDLEKIMESFKNRFGIRWVNETTSLAVFRTPADASDACSSIRFPFQVRVLTVEDELLSSIPARDLEPFRRRPETSARAARRMIAHGMGIRLDSSFGSNELRKQESERRKRLVSRKNLKDEAWGDYDGDGDGDGDGDDDAKEFA